MITKYLNKLLKIQFFIKKNCFLTCGLFICLVILIFRVQILALIFLSGELATFPLGTLTSFHIPKIF